MVARKRKTADLGDDPVDITADVAKRLFQHKRVRSEYHAARVVKPDMSELVRYVVENEEAFQSRGRLASLYADFQSQQHTNPDGYHANLNVWKKALINAARAGVVPAPGGVRTSLTLHTGPQLACALQHRDYGVPTCLPAVLNDAIRNKELIAVSEWKALRTSIYKKSWVPSPWDVLWWGWNKLAGPGDANKLAAGDFVVLRNLEIAAENILAHMKQELHSSTADRLFSKSAFLRRFGTELNPVVPLSPSELDILLIYLARDKQVISYNDRTIKFKAESEATPHPVTSEDTAIADLRDSMERVNAQLPALHERITSLDLTAREAVQAKQMIRAKAALRSKKLAESALSNRSALALRLEGAYMGLQQAADQIELVAAMKAGAEAMSVLHQKVGGVEGVQNVMDSVNEQVSMVEEISGIINESATPVDEDELDQEFEAMAEDEKSKKEEEEKAKVEARMKELDAAELAAIQAAREEAEKLERERWEKERQEKEKLEKERLEREREEKERREDEEVESKIDETSLSFSQLSVDLDKDEERVPVPA